MNPVQIGAVPVGAQAPFAVISGPCAAESTEVCVEVAARLAEACAQAGAGYVFKASFDKANRSSGGSGRGPGVEQGLEILAKVRSDCKVPVLTDIHHPEQAAVAAGVCDALQIPAFLCRQTDLVEAAAATGLPVLVKKGQFLAPQDMAQVVAKARAAGTGGVLVCERGSTFGYHNLVVDMRALVLMRGTGCPVVFDATHSVQLPGAAGASSGGERALAPALARAACAVGIDALFVEAHPDPAQAVSDAATQLPVDQACELVAVAARLSAIGRAAAPSEERQIGSE